MVKVKDLILPPYEARNPERWCLPNAITKSICILAGREASASLRIALGRHIAANAAQEATSYEPFTYWDWHGVAPDDTYAREYKKQRMWEHHGGFEVNGVAHGYPTPEERWRAFMLKVVSGVIDPRWVRRIAVAHWMSIEDLDWILSKLFELTDLDLSDAPTIGAGVAHPWALLLERDTHSLNPSLSELKWLGIPDFRNSADRFALDFVQKHCTKLQTLSIRGKQSKGEPVNAHDHICKLPYMIATHVPKSVTTLELRLPFLYLDRLVDVLKESKSPISRIGIDFGAWVQEYPKNPAPTNELRKDAVKEVAMLAAQKARFEAYKKAHEQTLGTGKNSTLPDSQFGQNLEQNYLEHAKHAFEHSFYAQESGSVPVSLDWAPQPAGSRCGLEKAGHHEDLFDYVESMDNSTLPAMLSGLHHFGIAQKPIELFALKPEWQERSMNPVHPVTMVRNGAPSDAYSMFEVYQWLNSTLKWRPVFDWDSFVGPNPKCSHKALLQRWNLDPKLKREQLLNAISTQFGLLNEAGVPIHIILGRRHPDSPSIYWGTPTSPPSLMEQYLKTPFEFSLKPIAPLISTLSIMYDLRHPLSISTTPSLATATCPRPTCPWHKICPFPIHPTWPSLSLTSSYAKQKMANSKPIKMSDPSLPDLAPNIPALPPTGHLPHILEDEKTLPIARRNAAFAREAIIWQMFWADYAPLFTGLDTLNVRMPKMFDGTASMKLAGLLDGDKGWRMRAWADENALTPGCSVWNGELMGNEEEDSGGGDFVRRCWVRREDDVVKKKEKVEEKEKLQEKRRSKRGALKREMDIVDEPWEMDAFGDTNMDTDVFRAPYPDKAVMDFYEAPGHDMDYTYPYSLERGEESVIDPALSEAEITTDDILEKDKEELDKAINRAVEAAELVERLEASDTSPPKTATKLESELKTVYGKRIARVARHAWLERVKGYLRELEPTNSGGSDVLRTTRTDLQARLANFSPEDIFVEDDQMKHGIGLVKQERNFAAEELDERGGPENGHQGDAGEEMQESDEHNSLFDSDVDYPGEQQPDNTDDGREDFYESTPPATHDEPVNVVQTPSLTTASQVGTQMSPNLDDILSTLQTHGGAIAKCHLLQHSTNEPSHDVRQSIEVSDIQSTMNQPGSTTVKGMTTAHIKTESVPAPSLPGIGLASQPREAQDLPKGKLYSSPPPKPKSEIAPCSSPKLEESSGAKKRSVSPQNSVEGTRKVAQESERQDVPVVSHGEPDAPSPKKSTPAKKSAGSRGKESRASTEGVEKPVPSTKELAVPLEQPTPPKKSTPSPAFEKPAPLPKKAPKQPRAKKPPAPKKTTKDSSPSLAPVKRPTRKRKDPVLAELEGKDQKEKDEVLGRTRTRGSSRSRSGTPAVYAGTSDEEDEEEGEDDDSAEGEEGREGKGRGAVRGKAKAKGKGKGKREADEEWGGGRGKNGKKSE